MHSFDMGKSVHLDVEAHCSVEVGHLNVAGVNAAEPWPLLVFVALPDRV